jgi:hypothetical protein
MSDMQLQYQSTIFIEPKTQLTHSHQRATLPCPELQKFSPHLNIPYQYLLLHKMGFQVLPVKTAYEFLFSRVCYINTPSQLT